MENDKSPGIDRIPIEFDKESYVLLVKNLLQPYNNIFFIKKNQQKSRTKHNNYFHTQKKQPKYPQILETNVFCKCKLQNLNKHFFNQIKKDPLTFYRKKSLNSAKNYTEQSMFDK